MFSSVLLCTFIQELSTIFINWPGKIGTIFTMGHKLYIGISREKIEAFCRKWDITELALFGSVLRDDFRPDSDVDVLVTFAPTADHSLYDVSDMQEELTTLLGRRVDLVEKKNIRNPFRRHEILRNNQVIFAA